MPGAIKDADRLLKSDNSLLAKINKVSKLVNGFETSFGLELLATVHWVATREDKTTLDDVIDGVYAWGKQKHKFSEKQIKIAYNILREQKWIKAID